MKSCIKKVVFFSVVMISTVLNGITIEELSSMFQNVRVSDLPNSTAWVKAMEATRKKLESMKVPYAKNDPKGLFAFYDQLLGMNNEMKQFMPSNSEAVAKSLMKRLAKVEKLSKATFGQKVKSFFAKKTNKAEEEEMRGLLSGALDLLRAKIKTLL